MTPGRVVVLGDEQRALERRLDRHAVDEHQPRPGVFAVLDDRAFDPALALARRQLHRQQAGEVARARAARLDDLDAVLGRRRCGRSRP